MSIGVIKFILIIFQGFTEGYFLRINDTLQAWTGGYTIRNIISYDFKHIGGSKHAIQ